MPGGREAHKAILWGGVRPSHRCQGLGTELLRWQVERASAATSSLDPALPARLNLDVAPHETDLLALADAQGFARLRTFLELGRPMARPIPAVEPPDGVDIVAFGPALDEPTRVAHNEAFADHWGSEPRSPEEWRQWYSGHRGTRSDLSRVAVERATGEVVGYVLTAAYPSDWEIGPVEAWINTVGTRPSWRGRGVSRSLLTAVLQAVAADVVGFERAILGVDSANASGAVRLYRGLGFEDVRVVDTFGREPIPAT